MPLNCTCHNLLICLCVDAYGYVCVFVLITLLHPLLVIHSCNVKRPEGRAMSVFS